MIALNAKFFASVKQNACTNYICTQEKFRVFNGAIDVTFSRKIDYNVRRFIFKHFINLLTVCNVAANKFEVGIILRVFQSFQITRVSQLVIANNFIVLVIFKHVVNKISADKTCSTRYNNFHIATALFKNKIQFVTFNSFSKCRRIFIFVR